MTSAITVDRLSKCYRLPTNRRPADAKPTSWPQWLRPRLRQLREEFWALKEVSFAVNPGEAVGIIGRNGAGKSTLLKVLSQITEPTAGRVELRGRVGSLLEVGTGFHPELSGRENIYLNASILGMRRREIQRKFDDIVQFAGVERFIDTPIKRYSSGMQVRLAFAVAAHIEPEILIIDEVLAVGDAEFQRRCTGKMKDVAAHGRTVLFVSHDLGAVQAMCRRAVWLQAGQIVEVGDAERVCRNYSQSVAAHAAGEIAQSNASADRPALRCFEMFDSAGAATSVIPFLDACELRIGFDVPEDCWGVRFVVRLRGDDGRQKAILASRELGHDPIDAPGHYDLRIVVPSMLCLPGQYTWEMGFYRTGDRGSPAPDYDGLAPFEILAKAIAGATHAYPPRVADFFLPGEMQIERVST